MAQLPGLGVAESDLEALWCLYLVELLRRQLELRSNSVAARVLQGPAALRALSASPPPPASRWASAAGATRHETTPLRSSDRPEEQVVRTP